MPPKYRHKRTCAACEQPKTFTRVINGHIVCSSSKCKEAVMEMEPGQNRVFPGSR